MKKVLSIVMIAFISLFVLVGSVVIIDTVFEVLVDNTELFNSLYYGTMAIEYGTGGLSALITAAVMARLVRYEFAK